MTLNRTGIDIPSSLGNPFSPKKKTTYSSTLETSHDHDHGAYTQREPNAPHPPTQEQDAPVDAELVRLRRERDELLATGIYNHDHKIIKQLEQSSI